MSLIQWSDQLSVGIPSIDEQHQKLVNMANTLNDALTAGQANEVLEKVFRGLVVYTQKHFGYEEELFAKHGYPASDAHRAEHDALRRQVGELQAKLDGGNFMIGVEVMSFLKGWLTNHILKSDKAYTGFLTSKGVS